jgi:hypothetical protein
MVDSLIKLYVDMYLSNPVDFLIICGDVATVDRCETHIELIYPQIDPNDSTVTLWVYFMDGLRKVIGPDHIIFTPGNHEYWGTIDHNILEQSIDGQHHRSMEQCEEFMSSWCHTHNIIYLNNGASFIYNDVAFIGAVGWADRAGFNNDYVFMGMGTATCSERRPFTVADSIVLGLAHSEAIDSTLSKLVNVAKNIVVITHTPPLRILAYLKELQTPCSYYQQDMYRVLDKYSKYINYWIYGHTHDGYCETTISPINIPSF